MNGPRVSLQQAGQLLDFAARLGGGQLDSGRALAQLEGAVATHNLLQRDGVAYLADEVGTGKTLVAAGAMALLRHREPDLRCLVLVPRGNLQRKWAQELRTFCEHNVTLVDLRVKGFDGGPVQPVLHPERLWELPALWALHPSGDVIARLSSFSLPYREGQERELVEHWRPILGGDDGGAVDELLARAFRERTLSLKESLAACLNRVLPDIGLLVVDEAHNLKHGTGKGVSSRNRVLWTALGMNPRFADLLPDYGPRARRVLLMSATPLEDDTLQVANQLDVVGMTAVHPELRAEDDAVRRQAMSRFLFRRLTELRLGPDRVPTTRNLYRQEWRRGGLEAPDRPQVLSDPRERLTMALVQKKVSEVLGHERFGGRFQIGMLTSFESLAQSAPPARTATGPEAEESNDVEAVFDDREQNEKADVDERLGIDRHAITALAHDHRRQFGEELHHPKMRAVVRRLSAGMAVGRKALVFTRRVASVTELVQQLNDAYDTALLLRLRGELPGALLPELDELTALYRASRWQGQPVELAEVDPEDGSTDPVPPAGTSLFGWFFRGESAPAGWLSGARLQELFRTESSPLYTTFRDNHAAAVLACPPAEVLTELARQLGTGLDEAVRALDQAALPFLGSAREPARGREFRAAQAAAVDLLRTSATDEGVRRRAAAAWSGYYADDSLGGGRRATARSVAGRLQEVTLLTLLREDRELCAELWHPRLPHDWADSDEFVERELRAALLSGAARLDHPQTDLWSVAVTLAGSMRRGAEVEPSALASGFLDRLRVQRSAGPANLSSWRLLRELAEHARLVLEVNDVRFERASVLRQPEWLGSRAPVVGMAGTVNVRAVRQFRTPSYPLVLVSTDLLQEGEDLHTFCDEVVHYGIAWMPSALEQRTGRVDRVRSLTDRRLARRDLALDGSGRPQPADRLQVLYPHLEDTLEVVQVRRVLSRLDRHIELLHEGLGGQERESPALSLDTELQAQLPPAVPSTERLVTAYPIAPDWWEGSGDEYPRVHAELARRSVALLQRARDTPAADVCWDPASTATELIGHVSVDHQRQHVSVRLTSVTGMPAARIVCGVTVLTGEALSVLPEVLALHAPCRVALTPTGQRREPARVLEAHDVVPLRDPQDLPDLDVKIREVAASAERMRVVLEQAGVLT